MKLSDKALRGLIARERQWGDECFQESELEPALVELLALRKVARAAKAFVDQGSWDMCDSMRVMRNALDAYEGRAKGKVT